MRQYRVLLPFSRPLSLNHRMHYMVKARLTADTRAAAAEAIMDAGVMPMSKLRAWIEYEPRDTRRRDPINLVPTLKVCEDALVDCGIVPDDNPEFVESVMPKILPKTIEKYGQLWFCIEEA